MKTNVLLFWDKYPFPDSVLCVFDLWKSLGSEWQVELLCFGSAASFSENHYGKEVCQAFKSCALPAMQSDFIRVFWVLANGGLYADLTFAPKLSPKFWSESDQFVCARWQHGRIINGIFYAKKGSRKLAIIAEEILDNVQSRTGSNIRNVTGPGVWNKIIGNDSDESFRVIDRQELFSIHITHSKYSATTRESEEHWSRKQKTMNIFIDPTVRK